jgi:hypothetical protein
MIFKFSMLLLLVLPMSCKKEYDVRGYMQNVNEDENYSKVLAKGKYSFQCSFLPVEYVTLLEMTRMNPEVKLSKEQFVNERSKFDNSLYFTFSIKTDDQSPVIKHDNLILYNEVQRNLENQMGSCFLLVTSEKDTLKTNLYHYSKSNGYANDLSFLVTFPKKEFIQSPAKYFDFVYVDKLLGESPTLFRFTTGDINKEPKIIF